MDKTPSRFEGVLYYNKAGYGKVVLKKIFNWIFEQVGIDLNHVHFLISAAPKYSPSEIIRGIKSITAKEPEKYRLEPRFVKENFYIKDMKK